MFFTKKHKLEKQLMDEIKNYAQVTEFPSDDARTISKLLVAYNKGRLYVDLQMMSAIDTIEKYPGLFDVWDELMLKYKRRGLFPKWDVVEL